MFAEQMQHFLSLSLCVTYKRGARTQLDTMTKRHEISARFLAIGMAPGEAVNYRWERKGAEVLVTVPVEEDVQCKVSQQMTVSERLGPFKRVESADSSGGCTLESKFEVFIFGRK